MRSRSEFFVHVGVSLYRDSTLISHGRAHFMVKIHREEYRIWRTLLLHNVYNVLMFHGKIRGARISFTSLEEPADSGPAYCLCASDRT